VEFVLYQVSHRIILVVYQYTRTTGNINYNNNIITPTQLTATQQQQHTLSYTLDHYIHVLYFELISTR